VQNRLKLHGVQVLPLPFSPMIIYPIALPAVMAEYQPLRGPLNPHLDLASFKVYPYLCDSPGIP
jgi:hypothetical protein